METGGLGAACILAGFVGSASKLSNRDRKVGKIGKIIFGWPGEL